MRRPSLSTVRALDPAVRLVALGGLVNVLGSGLVYPFATVHFHRAVGLPLTLVGLGLGVNGVATGVGNALGGTLADRVGRRPVMVGSMASAAVTLAGYAAVPALGAALPLPTGWAFVGVAALAGVTVGLYAPAAQAYVADRTAGSARDGAYAVLKVATNVGFGAGFVVGGLLYGAAGPAIFVADGATSAVVAALLLVAVPPADGAREAAADADSTPGSGSGSGSESGPGVASTRAGALATWRRALASRRVLALAGLNVGFAVMYAQMRTTIPVVAEGRLGLGAAALGTLYVLNPVTLVVLQLPVVDAVAGWRRTRGLALSAALWAASMLVVWPVSALSGWSGAGPAWLLGVALVGGHLVVRTVGEVLHAPLSTSLMSALGADGERGSRLALLEVAKRVGTGVGSFVGGAALDAGLGGLLWPSLAAACAAVAAGLLALERRVGREENGAAAAT